MRIQLNKIFQADSIAIVSDFDGPQAPGYLLMKHLAQGGFKGKVFAVALSGKAPGGATYERLQALPQRVSLVVICHEPSVWLEQVQACVDLGIGGIAFLSPGINPEHEQFHTEKQAALALARKYQLRVLGPNSFGFIAPHQRLNASFWHKMPLPGKLALISQSGALLRSILDWSGEQRVGFSYVVGPGGMDDISMADLIDYLGTDSHTACVLIYLENLKNARRFMSAARAFARYKPIIVLKAGRTEEGVQAAYSHTASLLNNDSAYDAAFRRVGIIRVNTVSQLFNIAQALAKQPRPRGPGLSIVSNGGGPGVLATDYLTRNGGKLSLFSQRTQESLKQILGTDTLPGHPVDLQGPFSEAQYAEVLKTCLYDEGTDGLLAIFSPQHPEEAVLAAQTLVKSVAKSGKPILAAWMGESEVKAARDILDQGGIPEYRFPESAVDVFLRMYQYSRDLEMLYETPPAIPQDFEPDREKAQSIIQRALAAGKTLLNASETKSLLACYRIPVTPERFCQNEEEVLAAGQAIGYPVVLKLMTPDAVHKTEIGGVQLHLNDENALQQAFRKMQAKVETRLANATIDGYLVEKMVYKTFEILLGAKKDPIFGPVIVVGRGGVATEVFRDTQAGLPPLNMALAQRLLEGTRMYPLLQGYRGMPGGNINELDFLLCRFAYLAMDFPQFKELEINPLMADSQGLMVVDAFAVLDPEAPAHQQGQYPHLVISPYPGAKYSKTVLLKSGEVVNLRPIRAEDEPALARMLQGASNDSLYMRFFGYIPKINHAWMTRFTHIDYDREMAIVAEVSRGAGRELVGTVRIIEDTWRESAEYAIFIADHVQGKGLGGIMTDYILDIARDRKIKKVVATVLPTNTAMIKLFEKRGFSIDRSDMEGYEVELLMVNG